MFVYVLLNDNKTVKAISDVAIDGYTRVFVSEFQKSTLMNSPFLCWVDKNESGVDVLHVPEDAPQPSYEQKIEQFKKQLAGLNEVQEALDKSEQQNKVLVTQLREGQDQINALAKELTALTVDDKAKSDELNKEKQDEDKSQSDEPQASEAQSQATEEQASDSAENQTQASEPQASTSQPTSYTIK